MLDVSLQFIVYRVESNLVDIDIGYLQINVYPSFTGTGSVMAHNQDSCRLAPCVNLSSMKVMFDHIRIQQQFRRSLEVLSSSTFNESIRSPTSTATKQQLSVNHHRIQTFISPPAHSPPHPAPPPPPPPPAQTSLLSHLPISHQTMMSSVASNPLQSVLMHSPAFLLNFAVGSLTSPSDRDTSKDNSIADLRLKAKKHTEALGIHT